MFKVLEELKLKRKVLEDVIEHDEREIRNYEISIRAKQEELEGINETIRILEKH